MAADIGDRLTAVEDRLAISELRARYCHYLDDGRWTDLVNLFTPDAYFHGHGLAQGHEEMLRYFSNDKGGIEAAWHRVLTEMTDLDGDRATGLSHWDCPAVVDGVPTLMAGRYHDEYVRTPEGWRISRRITRFAYVTPLSEGWRPGAVPPELEQR
jgi:SnoaL-like domain